jgi:Ca2+/Na+ antiporter
MSILQIAGDLATTATGYEELQKISGKIFFRLLIDLVSVFLLVRIIYYPIYKHRELFFTYFIFNLVIFLISFLLNKVDLSMGAAFGLFAVFSMLRYKTEEIAIKDMTYLFLVIAIGLICAVTKIKGADDNIEYIFLIAVNVVILLITWLLESNVLMKKEMVKTILYENIELIRTGKQDELLADLKLRTGFNIHRYSVHKIDFLKDAAQIKVYYYEN